MPGVAPTAWGSGGERGAAIAPRLLRGERSGIFSAHIPRQPPTGPRAERRLTGQLTFSSLQPCGRLSPCHGSQTGSARSSEAQSQERRGAQRIESSQRDPQADQGLKTPGREFRAGFCRGPGGRLRPKARGCGQNTAVGPHPEQLHLGLREEM